MSSGLQCVRPLHEALYDTSLGIRSAQRLATTAIAHDLGYPGWSRWSCSFPLKADFGEQPVTSCLNVRIFDVCGDTFNVRDAF